MVKEIDIKYILRAWANSLSGCADNVGYPSNSHVFVSDGVFCYKPVLNEDEINVINGAYQTLNKHNRRLSNLLKMYYLNHKSSRDISIILGAPKTKILSDLNQAEYFMMGCLCSFLAQSNHYSYIFSEFSEKSLAVVRTFS